jgi:hypothetical protein
MDEETIITLAQCLIDMRNPSRVDDFTEVLARLTDPEKDFSEYPTYHDCVLGIQRLLGIDADTETVSASTSTPSTPSGDVDNTDTDDASPNDENPTLVPFLSSSSDGVTGAYALPSDFPLPHANGEAKDGFGADNYYTLMVPSEEMDDSDTDVDDFSLPVDEDDPYSMTLVDEDDIDTSVLPLDEAIASTSSGPKSPLSGSAPTVDTQSADDSMKSFALFDAHLPEERREILLAGLKRWFEEQIAPMHLPLPPCVLQHQGPLVSAYAVFGEFTYANMVATKDSRAYTPYNASLTQFVAHTVTAHGIWYPELAACLAAKAHVALKASTAGDAVARASMWTAP